MAFTPLKQVSPLGTPPNVIGSPQAEYAREQEWIAEGRTLVAHAGAPPFFQGKGQAPRVRALAVAEADVKGLRGALRRLFLREREEGWIAAGQFENVDEQGFLDFLITPLTLGLVHGPGAGSSTLKQNPKTGAGENVKNESAVESAEHAVPSLLSELEKLVNAYGLRLAEVIGGAVLILFGLVTLAKGGQPPSLPSAIPIPV